MKFVSALKESLEKPLSIYVDKLLYRLAATLNPCFKLAWHKENEMKELRDVLIKEAKSVTSSSAACPTDSSPKSMIATPIVKQSRLFSYITAGTDALKTTSQTPDTICQEATSYLADPYLSENRPCEILGTKQSLYVYAL